MKKFCVLGHDIGYTRSPALHRAIFRFLGEDGTYDVADVPEERLAETVRRLLEEYDGFNVTKPYKEKVAALLGERDPVNTVRKGGKCTSTDPVGFITDYTDTFGIPCGKILLLGAGGAAKSVAQALSAYPAVQLCLFNRTPEKAAALASACGGTAVDNTAGRYDAVINATSLGLHGEQAAPEELDFRRVRYAYDLIYAPPVTPFLRRARENGVKTQNGLGMLVWQAIAAQEFWRDAPFADGVRREMAAAVKKELEE